MVQHCWCRYRGVNNKKIRKKIYKNEKWVPNCINRRHLNWNACTNSTFTVILVHSNVHSFVRKWTNFSLNVLLQLLSATSFADWHVPKESKRYYNVDSKLGRIPLAYTVLATFNTSIFDRPEMRNYLPICWIERLKTKNFFENLKNSFRYRRENTYSMKCEVNLLCSSIKSNQTKSNSMIVCLYFNIR